MAIFFSFFFCKHSTHTKLARTRTKYTISINIKLEISINSTLPPPPTRHCGVMFTKILAHVRSINTRFN